MQIASLGEGKEARRIHLDLCSSTVFGNYGSMTKQWGGVVYRSWTFGFDSDIPRVTISGRFCDWTGSRGLHLLVSETGYAINGKPVNGETLPPPPPIASLGEGKEARRIHLDLCSSTVFGNYGSMTKQWGGLPYLGAC
ncbi:hypothetical protein GQ457_13G029480 [Hibiscus cannabinus]